MKRFFFTSTFLTICLAVFGQHNFGAKLSGGMSKITTDRNLYNQKTKYMFAPSGQAGLFYELDLGKKSTLGLELLFSQIESKEEMEIIYTDFFGRPTGESGSVKLDYHISYFSIPIYYGLKIKDLTINLGVQTSFVLANRGHYVSKTTYNGSTIEDEDEDRLNIDSYDFGLRAGLMYSFSKKFAVEATYYYGVNNIMNNNGAPPSWNWKVQQMIIGLRYTFFSLAKK